MKRLGRRHEVPVRWLSDKALRVLRSHTWPGNLPELERTLERAVMLCSGESLIDPVDLGLLLKGNLLPA